MSAALVISVIAILIALFSLRLSVRADRRQDSAELRESRRERRELEESTERRSGKPVITPDGLSGGSTAERVTHGYKVRNSGQSTITKLVLWIEDAQGNPISTSGGGPGFVIAPNDPPQFASVDVLQPVPAGELTLVVSWEDAEGEHGPESTGLHPAPHA
jgi:hypothetical protein